MVTTTVWSQQSSTKLALFFLTVAFICKDSCDSGFSSANFWFMVYLFLRLKAQTILGLTCVVYSFFCTNLQHFHRVYHGEKVTQRKEKQSRMERRRYQLRMRKQQKRYFKKVIRFQRFWREMTNIVHETHGITTSFFCNISIIRLVIALHYVSFCWLSYALHEDLTALCLEYWIRRVSAHSDGSE